MQSFVFFALWLSPLIAQIPTKGIVDWEQKTGQIIPLDIPFYDETGKVIHLKDILKRPAILALVYYSCSGICTPLLNDLKRELERIQLEPGKDFQVITISFNPEETPELARKKKRSYFQLFKRSFPENAWRFLTGKEDSIVRITKAVGFHFRKEGDVFRHPGGVVILSPQGKICRYIYGGEFLAPDLELALRKAKQGIAEPAIPKVVTPQTKLFCFVVDAEGKIIGLHITNTLMLLIFISVTAFGGFLFYTTVWQEWKKGGEHARNQSSR